MKNEDKYRELMNKAVKKINSLNSELESYKNRGEVAVVGYNCRFPGGANSAQDFWDLLCEGYDAVSEIPEERFDFKPYFDAKKSVVGKTYVKSGSFLNYDIKKFDNYNFEMNETEATSLDPQHRLLLEVTWEAIQNSGINFEDLKGSRTGVFIGIDSCEYSMAEVVSGELTDITPYSLMGNSAHAAAGRIAYYFDLKGPVMSFDTACSSSLTALNAAMQAFKSDQCNIAIVGGINLMLSPNIFVSLSQLKALSPDGKCKAFDSSADGFGRGEGCGVIILKRLKDAVSDGSYIEAVIKSTSVEHDGRTNGFYAPNGKSEKNVIMDAIGKSGVSVDDIDYIETHGTGTVMGDSIEAQAMCEAFYDKKALLKIGSVKTNIGHLEAAAGMAGILKVLLSMHFGYLPETIHFNNPNPEINFQRLHVVNHLEHWNKNDKKRAAGISSFGISGTLVHAILQDAEIKKQKTDNLFQGILTLSAASEEHLKAYIKEFRNWLQNSEFSLEKVLVASNMTRSNMKYRFSFQGNKKVDIIKILDDSVENDSLFEQHFYCKKRKAWKIDIYVKEDGEYDNKEIDLLYSYSEIFRNYYNHVLEDLLISLNLNVKGADLHKKEKKISLERKAVWFAGTCGLINLLNELGVSVGKVYGDSASKIVADFMNGKASIESVAEIYKNNKKAMSSDDLSETDILIFEGCKPIKNLMTNLQKAYMNGFDIKWGIFHKDAAFELPILPNYCFERKIFWKNMDFNGISKEESDSSVNISISAESTKNLESVKDRVFNLVAGILSIKKEYISEEKSLLAYGFDSYSFLKLADQIKEQFGVNIEVQDLFGFYSSIGAIVELIESNNTLQEKDNFSTDDTDSSVEYEKNYPMSSVQKRLYSQISMTNVDPFDMVGAYFVGGNINLDRFRWAVNEVLHRHKILSTALFMQNGEFVQKNIPDTEIKIREISQNVNNELDDFISDSLCRFELSNPPLMEVLLIHTYDNKQMMIFHFHHTVVDGVSMNIFSQEVMKLYSGSKLAPLNYQYYDYVLWEEKYVQSEEFLNEKKFWEECLQNVDGKIDLPYDKSDIHVNSMSGASITCQISGEITDKVRNFCINNQMTMFMTFLVATDILMHKLSNKDDIYLAVPIACRNKGQFQDNIGMFTNTLAFCANVEKCKKISTLIGEVKNFCLSAYKYPDYQFSMISDENNLNLHQALNVAYVYENIGERLESPEGLIFSMYDYTSRIQEFEVSFEILEHNGTIDCVVRYQKDLFSEKTIARMIAQLLLILSQLVSVSKDTAVKKISIVSDAEKQRVLYEFNKTELSYNKEETIVSAFEKLVKLQSEHVALNLYDQELTYGELNRRANQLAHRLREYEIGKDDFVILEVIRSFEMFIAIIGIMKAGGAYVPVDPSYPDDRKQYIIKECAAKCVVTYKVEDTFDDVVHIAMEKLSDAMEYNENLDVIVESSNLAYCIFTSGTSGTPKGVMIEHHGVIAMQAYLSDLYKVTREDHVLQFANYVFDASVWEFTMSLLMGATLVLVSTKVIDNINEFNRYVKEHNITYTLLPPQYYLLTDINRLKVLTTGGSASNREVLNKARENARYINAYGPTENTVLATHWEDTGTDGIIPIGKPISNMKAYVLDDMELCGIGMPGELCLTGDLLARGYLNRDGLTEQKFIRNPYGFGRMYRTGDLVRWTEDGNIEYMGRMDEQVKIRGYRIELGEIESLIRQVDGILDATVIAKEDHAGEQAIFAYYVSDEVIEENLVINNLKKSLPSYMIPSGIQQIDEIPFNASGKVDCKCLPVIEQKTKKEYVAPRNSTEEFVCKVFENILRTSPVGIYDDFFELGGHSLRVTRMINLIMEKYGYQIESREIFENETPEKIAKLIEEQNGEKIEQFEKTDDKEYYPISAAQKRIFVVTQMEPDCLNYNLPACIRIEGSLDSNKLQYSLNEVVRKYEILRTKFEVINDEFVQRVYDELEIKFICIEGNTEDMEGCLKEFVRPFRLGELPLLRLKMIKGQSESLLLLDMHHIISDGMSMKIFIDELVFVYNNKKLKPVAYQYRDYCNWFEKKISLRVKNIGLTSIKKIFLFLIYRLISNVRRGKVLQVQQLKEQSLTH